MVTGEGLVGIRDQGLTWGEWAASWRNAVIGGSVGGPTVMLRKRLVLPRFTFVYTPGVPAEQR